MTEAPVATAYTLDFVLENLPEGARDLLEVGCGEGELAAALAERGFTIVALDTSAESVDAARARGVDARIGEWPIAVDRQFDAVLLTRSLHHVHDLSGGVAAGREALKPGGRMIVEDFRAEGGLERSAAWFAGLTRTLLASGALVEGFDLEQTLAKVDFSTPEHSLHSSVAIAEALTVFGSVQESESAYFFRYLETELSGGDAAAEALLRHEITLVEAGCIDPLGKRFVACD